VAIKGCIGVFHVATPLPQDFGNGEAEEVVIQGAADGTLGILKACLNSKTVKRVVYTSSASAVAFNDSGVEMMDGSYWSNVDYTELIFKKQFKKSFLKKTSAVWAGPNTLLAHLINKNSFSNHGLNPCYSIIRL